jgi:hypothetical protein
MVVVGAALVADGIAAVEDIADIAGAVAELVDSLDLVAWHPDPISANPAIAAVSASVRLVIARIIFLSNWIRRPSAYPKRMLFPFETTQQGRKNRWLAPSDALAQKPGCH